MNYLYVYLYSHPYFDTGKVDVFLCINSHTVVM